MRRRRHRANLPRRLNTRTSAHQIRRRLRIDTAELAAQQSRWRALEHERDGSHGVAPAGSSWRRTAASRRSSTRNRSSTPRRAPVRSVSGDERGRHGGTTAVGIIIRPPPAPASLHGLGRHDRDVHRCTANPGEDRERASAKFRWANRRRHQGVHAEAAGANCNHTNTADAASPARHCPQPRWQPRSGPGEVRVTATQPPRPPRRSSRSIRPAPVGRRGASSATGRTRAARTDLQGLPAPSCGAHDEPPGIGRTGPTNWPRHSTPIAAPRLL